VSNRNHEANRDDNSNNNKSKQNNNEKEEAELLVLLCFKVGFCFLPLLVLLLLSLVG